MGEDGEIEDEFDDEFEDLEEDKEDMSLFQDIKDKLDGKSTDKPKPGAFPKYSDEPPPAEQAARRAPSHSPSASSRQARSTPRFPSPPGQISRSRKASISPSQPLGRPGRLHA